MATTTVTTAATAPAVRLLSSREWWAAAATAVLTALAAAGWFPWEVAPLEALAVATGAWSVWLLARNRPSGWWIGIASVILFGIVFFRVRLFAETGIQAFYLVTSVQAIWLWLRGGAGRTGRPVTYLKRRSWVWIVPAFGASWIALHSLLVAINGAFPLWDSLTTVMSLAAHLLLMGRFVNSWHLWIAVDVIYVPLYFARGLTLTSLLYVAFLTMSIAGLARFRQLARERANA